MTIETPVKPLTLAEFLEKSYIEESPAYEYINNTITQKPMPQTHHSRLQLKLASLIDLNTEEAKIAIALPELRCTFGERSIVPDIAVILWAKIPFNENDEPQNGAIFFAPDWVIEILSLNQKSTKVIDNIVHCLEYGSQLGWLIDCEERAIVVFQPQQTPAVYRHNQQLPILKEINLELTPDQIFTWLKIKR